MSRVYFHTRTSTAQLRGSERAWLRHIAGNAARPWWGLDALDPLDRALEIVDMIAPESEGQYVRDHAAAYRAAMDYTLHPTTSNHTTMLLGLAEQARADRKHYRDALRGRAQLGNLTGRAHYDGRAKDTLIEILRTCLHVTNLPLRVAGRTVYSMDVEMNTAIAVGWDAVALAAKIYGWCEVHPWISEADREGFAELIEYAIDLGLYRGEIWHVDKEEQEWTPQGWDHARKLISQGWDEVMALLRDTKHHPGEVVLSASVCDRFPNPDISTTMPPWPVGVPLRWDCLTQDQQEERTEARLQWTNLGPDQQWETGMEGLKSQRPWANITLDNLSTGSFGPPVDLLDLFHHDRDNRIEQAFQRFEQTFNHPGQEDHDGPK